MTLRGVATQVAGLALGLVAGWAAVGEAWVQFDRLVGMWVVAAVVVGCALAAIVVRRQLIGLGVGLLLSASVCAPLFTWFDVGMRTMS